MRIAVIGCGWWGKNLIRNFNALGSLYAICDSNKSRLAEFGNKYPGTKAVGSYDKILKDEKVDAVAIATQAASHYKMVKKALLAGKDVFVEKPLALTAKEGAKLVKLSAKTKRILMVGHLLEYHPGILKLKSLIDKGELGKIRYIYSSRLNLGKIRREENILWSFAPHDISVILLLLNETPVAVSAYGGNYLHKNIADVTVSTMRFKSGVRSHIFVSWLHPFKEQKLVVVGSKKMAVFDDVLQKNKLLLYPHKIDLGQKVPIAITAKAQKIPFSNKEPLREECIHFIKCVKNGTSPRTNPKSALRVLKVLQACQKSLEKNGGRKIG